MIENASIEAVPTSEITQPTALYRHFRTEKPRHNKVHAYSEPRPARRQPGDRHKNPGVLIRPDAQLIGQARAALDANNWTMNDFLVACLVLLTMNPTPMLTRLAEFRPQPKRGRPKKKAPPSGGA